MLIIKNAAMSLASTLHAFLKKCFIMRAKEATGCLQMHPAVYLQLLFLSMLLTDNVQSATGFKPLYLLLIV
jgi:hypothetical protein